MLHGLILYPFQKELQSSNYRSDLKSRSEITKLKKALHPPQCGQRKGESLHEVEGRKEDLFEELPLQRAAKCILISIPFPTKLHYRTPQSAAKPNVHSTCQLAAPGQLTLHSSSHQLFRDYNPMAHSATPPHPHPPSSSRKITRQLYYCLSFNQNIIATGQNPMRRRRGRRGRSQGKGKLSSR